MNDLHRVSGFLQPLSHVFGNHHRAVLSTGASKTDRQIALAFMHVVRQQVDQQIGNAVDEFLGLREGPYVPCNLRIAPGERTKRGHEMRIGQESNVKYQVGVVRNAVLKTKADARNQDRLDRCQTFE